jgi:hypothetical protein
MNPRCLDRLSANLQFPATPTRQVLCPTAGTSKSVLASFSAIRFGITDYSCGASPKFPDCASEGAVEHQRPGEGECAARTAALKILTMQGFCIECGAAFERHCLRAGSTISRERSFAAAVTRRSRSQPRLRSAVVDAEHCGQATMHRRGEAAGWRAAASDGAVLRPGRLERCGKYFVRSAGLGGGTRGALA